MPPRRAVPGTPINPPPAAAAPTMKERMAALGKKGGKAEPKGKKDKDRPLIVVDDPVVADQIDHASAGNTVLKFLGAPVETAKTEAKDFVLTKMLEIWAESRHRTENPDIQTSHTTGTFQLKSRHRIVQPDGGDTPALDVQLRGNGVNDNVVNALASRILVKPTFEFKKVDESWGTGTAHQQSLLAKLLGFMDTLEPEEAQLFYVFKEEVTDLASDFLDFLPTIPGIDADQMRRVLEVTKHEVAFNPLVFAGDVVPYLKDMIGSKVGIGENKSPDEDE